VTIEEIGGGDTRMSIVSAFPTVAAMEQLAAMGMWGLPQTVGQIDAILAEDPAEADDGSDGRPRATQGGRNRWERSP